MNCFISACADGMRKFVLVRNNHVTVMATYLVHYPREFAWLAINKMEDLCIACGKITKPGDRRVIFTDSTEAVNAL